MPNLPKLFDSIPAARWPRVKFAAEIISAGLLNDNGITIRDWLQTRVRKWISRAIGCLLEISVSGNGSGIKDWLQGLAGTGVRGQLENCGRWRGGLYTGPHAPLRQRRGHRHSAFRAAPLEARPFRCVASRPKRNGRAVPQKAGERSTIRCLLDSNIKIYRFRKLFLTRAILFDRVATTRNMIWIGVRFVTLHSLTHCLESLTEV